MLDLPMDLPCSAQLQTWAGAACKCALFHVMLPMQLLLSQRSILFGDIACDQAAHVRVLSLTAGLH